MAARFQTKGGWVQHNNSSDVRPTVCTLYLHQTLVLLRNCCTYQGFNAYSPGNLVCPHQIFLWNSNRVLDSWSHFNGSAKYTWGRTIFDNCLATYKLRTRMRCIWWYKFPVTFNWSLTHCKICTKCRFWPDAYLAELRLAPLWNVLKNINWKIENSYSD